MSPPIVHRSHTPWVDRKSPVAARFSASVHPVHPVHPRLYTYARTHTRLRKRGVVWVVMGGQGGQTAKVLCRGRRVGGPLSPGLFRFPEFSDSTFSGEYRDA